MNYARARDIRSERTFESLDEVSQRAIESKDGVQVQGLRLKSDNIKWKLARMNPKKYGDKIDTTLSAPGGGPVQVEHKVEMDWDPVTRLIKQKAK